MNLFVNKRLRVSKDIITRVKRTLAGREKILVRLNQEVSPYDRIGRSITSSGYRNINLAEKLLVSPNEAQLFLQRQIGQKIFKGELLAFRKGGVFSGNKIIISPSDGILDFYNGKTGEIRLQLPPHEVDLPAAVFGIVESVNQLKGEVVIKTQVTEIFGLLGMGKAREGILKVLGSRGDLVNKHTIAQSMEGRILVGGGLVYKDAISEAATIGVNGIITGGINVKDYKLISGGEISLSLLVTEGFGTIPIGEDIFDTLVQYNNKFAILDGSRSKLTLPTFTSDCMVKIRSSEFPKIPDVVDTQGKIDVAPLLVGCRVRVIGFPFMGEQGKVEAIDQTISTLPSQIVTYTITVQTKSRKIRVPYSNVEIIG